MGHDNFWGIAPLIRGLKNPKSFLILGGIIIVVICVVVHAKHQKYITAISSKSTSSSSEVEYQRNANEQNSTNDKTEMAWTIENVDPFSLDLAHRFDIIIKCIYGIFHTRGAMTPFVRAMYSRHIQVWNNFHEPCKFIGDKDWFDSTKPCVKKRNFEDYENSFTATIDAIAQKGFNNSISVVPVTSKGFPLNGAHRIAAALALSLNTMPVQIVSSNRREGWGRGFFKHLGLEAEYVDFAEKHWRLHVKNSSTEDEYWMKYILDVKAPLHVHAVNVFPSTRGMHHDKIIHIINQYATILTQRFVHFNSTDAADMFVQHLYPSESWVAGGGSRGKTNPCFPKGTESLPAWIIFIQTKHPLDMILKMKAEIRGIYKLGKHSVHISDKNTQAASIAKIVLNRNSVKVLNTLKWSTPSKRRHNSPCIPASSDNQTLIYYLDNEPCNMALFESGNLALSPIEASDQEHQEKLDQESPKESDQESPEESAQESPEESDQESYEESHQQSPEESHQQSPEESDQQSPEESDQQSPEESGQESPEESEQQSPEESDQSTPESDLPANNEGEEAANTACGGIPRITTKTHWTSIEEMFEALNAANVSYALLRNFEKGVVHPEDNHPDIDILIGDLEPACCVMTVYGGPQARCKKNIQNQGQHITVGGVYVKLDLRVLGDGYYEDNWVKDMLTRRVQGHVPQSQAFSLAPEDLLFSMVYHVLVHKRHIAEDYPDRLCLQASELGYSSLSGCDQRPQLMEFLQKHWMIPHGYSFVRPLDRNVPYHPPSEGEVMDGVVVGA